MFQLQTVSLHEVKTGMPEVRANTIMMDSFRVFMQVFDLILYSVNTVFISVRDVYAKE